VFGSWLPFVWKVSAATRAALSRWLVPLCEEDWPPHKISARRAAGADSLQDGGVDALAEMVAVAAGGREGSARRAPDRASRETGS
jgi:hypothetical protein